MSWVLLFTTIYVESSTFLEIKLVLFESVDTEYSEITSTFSLFNIHEETHWDM